MHRARWMAKLLYAVKMCMSEHQILKVQDKKAPTRKQMSKLRQFVTFVTHVYGLWWMTCQDPVDAPWHDLNFVHQLLRYRDLVDEAVGKSALRAFSRHQWYLTEEMAPLTLFSCLTPDFDSELHAKRMLERGQKPNPRFP